jgi:hypothetical protein
MEVSAAIVILDIDCLTLQHVLVNKIVYFHLIKYSQLIFNIMTYWCFNRNHYLIHFDQLSLVFISRMQNIYIKSISHPKFQCFHFQCPKYLYQMHIDLHLASLVKTLHQFLIVPELTSSVKMSKDRKIKRSFKLW